MFKHVKIVSVKSVSPASSMMSALIHTVTRNTDKQEMILIQRLELITHQLWLSWAQWFISYSSKYLRPELRRRIMVAWFVIIQLVVTLKLFCTSDWFIADETEHLKLKMASLHRLIRIQLNLIWVVRDANQQSRMQQRKTLLHNLAMGTCLQISASQSRN